MKPFHPVAWIAWCACALATTQALANPVLLLVALFALVYTAVASGGDRGPIALMLKIGLFVIVTRVVLFGLAGHPNGTTLLTLPEVRLPSLLGGFRLGGAITGEVLVTSGTEGLRLASVLACFGVFLAMVEPARALRLVPRFLFEAGLVVAIGVMFVPSLVRTARDVRDAQWLRGYRRRGPRAAAALAMPVLATTLERSSAIAESMEARGYGRARAFDARAESHARAFTLGGIAVASAGVFGLLARLHPVALAWGLLLAGTSAFALGSTRLSRLSVRTRYRRDAIRAADLALIVAGAATAALAIAFRSRLGYSAYPFLTAPRTPLGGLTVASLLAAPVAIRAIGDARLRAFS